jgi:hypothetical protein
MSSSASVLTHSFELPEVKEATLKLITDNAEHLINYIYANTSNEPYHKSTVRVGLVIKTLLKTDSTNNPIKSTTIEPAINDLLALIGETKDQRVIAVYQEELRFLKSCTILDDMITLNTELRAKA